MKHLNLVFAGLAILIICGLCPPAYAGFTQTLPQGAFLLEETFIYAWLDSKWDDDGNSAPLIDEIERYEPGGGMQGILHAEPTVTSIVLATQLQYGILDYLSIGIGIPVVLETNIDPKLSWESGDYIPRLGRAFSEYDFWEWADSMGQPKPEAWSGNKGKLADIILGVRYRFTDHFPIFNYIGLHMGVSILGNIPTGSNADPEEVVNIGTTNWDLQTTGDLSFRYAIDKTFEEELDGRLSLGLEGHYDIFFSRTLSTPTGEKNPLLLNYAPYVGPTYERNGGDQAGFAFAIGVVPYRGPALGTWLNGGDSKKAEKFPPIISLNLKYAFTYLMQSEWSSLSPHWDYEREDDFFPGYKNRVGARATFSFLRLGAPIQVYGDYATLNLIPGKNVRASSMAGVGLQIIMKFW